MTKNEKKKFYLFMKTILFVNLAKFHSLPKLICSFFGNVRYKCKRKETIVKGVPAKVAW